MTMKKFGTFAVAGALCLFVAGCSGEPLTTREQGTLIGGGSAVGHPAAGAAIGGVGGAATGYAIGNHEQNQQDYYRGDN
jgi:hypothetical protein